MRLSCSMLALTLVLCGCRRREEPPPYPSYGVPPPGAPMQGAAMPGAPMSRPPDATGQASYYADSLAGNTTASGDVYDPAQLTAAHRTLPFGTVVDVRRRDTGATVRVRINDRGPFGNERRIIDLSRRAAETIGMIRAGVVDVELRIVSQPR